MQTTNHQNVRRHRQAGGILSSLLSKIVVWSVVVVLLVSLYLARGPILRGFIEWWIVDDELHPAQVAIVLGCDSIFADRLRHAVELNRRGLVQQLVLSGQTIRTNFNEAVLMEKDALDLGVPPGSLLPAPQNAESTVGEALALRRLLAENNIRSAVVVTSDFHTRRARMIFRDVFEASGVELQFSAARDVRFNPRRWWQHRSSRNLVFLELVKSFNSLWELHEIPDSPRPELPEN